MSTFKSAFKSFKDLDNAVYLMLVVFFCFYAAGAFAQSGNMYSERSAQTSSPVTLATVLQVREVRQEAHR